MVCVAIEETWNGLGKGKGKKARSLRSLARLEVRRSGWPGLGGEGLGKDRALAIGNGGEWDWVCCVWRGLENLNICKGKGVEAGVGVGKGKLEWASAKDSESFRRGKRNLLATRF